MVDAFLLPFATHHRFISFVLYVIGKSFVYCQFTEGGRIHMKYLYRICVLCRELEEGTVQISV